MHIFSDLIDQDRIRHTEKFEPTVRTAIQIWTVGTRHKIMETTGPFHNLQRVDGHTARKRRTIAIENLLQMHQHLPETSRLSLPAVRMRCAPLLIMPTPSIWTKNPTQKQGQKSNRSSSISSFTKDSKKESISLMRHSMSDNWRGISWSNKKSRGRSSQGGRRFFRCSRPGSH